MKRLLFVLLACLLVAGIALPATAAQNTLTISSDPGADSFTDGAIRKGVFNVSLSGTWVGTVTVQRSFDRFTAANDAAATWRDVATYTANTEDMLYEPEANVYYRIGMENGDYTSGTCNMRLGR